MKYYMLFENHTDAMAMYGAVKEQKLFAQIAPTPRRLSVSCGVSLILHEEEIPQIEALAEKENLAYIDIKTLDISFDGSRYRNL